MKIKSIFLTVFSIISILLLQNCDTKEIIDPNNPTNATTSKVQLKLVDAQDDTYLEVWVEIIDVQYNRNDDETGWISFDGYPKSEGVKVDLLTLTAGSSHILTDQDIESGMLSKVRLILGEENWIKIEEQVEPIRLKTPSAQQSGLKLHLNTELVAGYSYTFVLDWDVQKSIVKAGNSGNYNLKPIIRVIAEANSGTILGRIADILEFKDGAEPSPIGGAIISLFPDGNYTAGTEITSTISSEGEDSEGLFMLQGLPGGDSGTDYYLRIEYSEYDVLDYGPVMVNNGQDTDVETLYLTKSTGIKGKVTEKDDSSTVIEGAEIKAYLVTEDTSTTPSTFTETFIKEGITNDEGNYLITGLDPGKYILKVTASLYDPYDISFEEAFSVVINEINEIDIELTVTP